MILNNQYGSHSLDHSSIGKSRPALTVSSGKASKKVFRPFNPPADAPRPTTVTPWVCDGLSLTGSFLCGLRCGVKGGVDSLLFFETILMCVVTSFSGTEPVT